MLENLRFSFLTTAIETISMHNRTMYPQYRMHCMYHQYKMHCNTAMHNTTMYPQYKMHCNTARTLVQFLLTISWNYLFV